MRALCRWLLVLVLLGTVGCASGDLGVIVTVEGWPVEALSMRVRTSVDGVSREELQIPSGQNRFVVRLSPGERGPLVLDATALDRGGCKVATGQLAMEFGFALHPTQEARLQLNRLTNILCTLTVDFTEGTGSVVSDPAGILGESPGVREFDFSSGTPVRLLPLFDGKAQYVLWNGDCAGSAGCALLMDRSRQVEVAFPRRICTPSGFCWHNPLPQGSTLHEVWVDPDGVAWTVGDGGTVLKCRGKSCTPLDSGSTSTLNSLSGRSGQEVWAVGDGGTVAKCGASACAAISSGTANNLLSAWGSSGSGDVWAVGDSGTVIKCSGNPCGAVSSGTSNRLRRVWGHESGEVWAVGDSGTVIKCSGSACNSLAAGTSSDLYGVFVTGPGAAVAVGDNGTVLRCSGSSCSPIPTGRTDLLFGVIGRSTGELFVHGGSGTLLKCSGDLCTPLTTQTIALLNKVWISQSGEVWAAASNGDVLKCGANTCALLSAGTGLSLDGIAGDGAGQVWAVGTAGTLVRCAGEKCLSISSGAVTNLGSISGTASGEVWAGGQGLIRCTGGSCTTITRQTEGRLEKVTANRSSGEIWAVGSLATIVRCSGSNCIELDRGYQATYYDLVLDQLGRANVVGNNGMLHCAGTSCVNEINGIPFRAVVGNSAEVWAGGSAGDIVKWDLKTNNRQFVTSGTTDYFENMWMSSASEVWAVGGQSIIRCSGTSCTKRSPNTPNSLHAVWGSSSGEVWTVGDRLNVFKCSNTAPPICNQIYPMPAVIINNSLFSIKGDQRGGVWAVGSRGSLVRCSGTTCAKISLGFSDLLNDVWISGAGEVWVAGHGGAILSYTP